MGTEAWRSSWWAVISLWCCRAAGGPGGTPAAPTPCWPSASSTAWRSTGCPAALRLQVLRARPSAPRPRRRGLRILSCAARPAGAEALLLEAREAQAPAGGLWDGALPEDVVVALERQLCGVAAIPAGEASRQLQERRCFRPLLRSLELPGAEKAVGLRIIRWGSVAAWGPGAGLPRAPA